MSQQATSHRAPTLGAPTGFNMRTLIFGSGAIGGLLGAHLIRAGAEVGLFDRGRQLTALQSHGLRLLDTEGELHSFDPAAVVAHPRDFGPVDVVILAVKAHQIRPALDLLEVALSGDTVLLTTQNGIPWWYFQRSSGPFADHVLRSVDPDGELAHRIGAERIVGCIAYPAATVVEPGVIRHVEGHRFPIGELDGSDSDRCKTISEWLVRAGFKAPILEDVRSEIWLKAWGNLAFNPVSALTGLTMAEICRTPPTRDLVSRMMTEAADVAAQLGITFRVPLEKRLAGAERVGHHKTSMLQDLESGQPLEIEAILGSILELGVMVGVRTDTLRAVCDLTRAMDPGSVAQN